MAESLFSLEVLVQVAEMPTDAMAKVVTRDLKPSGGPEPAIPRAVALRLLDFPLLTVRRRQGPDIDQDGPASPGHSPSPAAACRPPLKEVRFDCGKSCLFKADAAEMEALLRESPMYVMYLDVTSPHQPKLLSTGRMPLSIHYSKVREPGMHEPGTSDSEEREEEVLDEAGGLIDAGAEGFARMVVPMYSEMGQPRGRISVCARLTCHGPALLGHVEALQRNLLGHPLPVEPVPATRPPPGVRDGGPAQESSAATADAAEAPGANDDRARFQQMAVDAGHGSPLTVAQLRLGAGRRPQPQAVVFYNVQGASELSGSLGPEGAAKSQPVPCKPKPASEAEEDHSDPQAYEAASESLPRQWPRTRCSFPPDQSTFRSLGSTGTEQEELDDARFHDGRTIPGQLHQSYHYRVRDGPPRQAGDARRNRTPAPETPGMTGRPGSGAHGRRGGRTGPGRRGQQQAAKGSEGPLPARGGAHTAARAAARRRAAASAQGEYVRQVSEDPLCRSSLPLSAFPGMRSRQSRNVSHLHLLEPGGSSYYSDGAADEGCLEEAGATGHLWRGVEQGQDASALMHVSPRVLNQQSIPGGLTRRGSAGRQHEPAAWQHSQAPAPRTVTGVGALAQLPDLAGPLGHVHFYSPPPAWEQEPFSPGERGHVHIETPPPLWATLPGRTRSPCSPGNASKCRVHPSGVHLIGGSRAGLQPGVPISMDEASGGRVMVLTPDGFLRPSGRILFDASPTKEEGDDAAHSAPPRVPPQTGIRDGPDGGQRQGSPPATLSQAKRAETAALADIVREGGVVGALVRELAALMRLRSAGEASELVRADLEALLGPPSSLQRGLPVQSAQAETGAALAAETLMALLGQLKLSSASNAAVAQLQNHMAGPHGTADREGKLQIPNEREDVEGGYSAEEFESEPRSSSASPTTHVMHNRPHVPGLSDSKVSSSGFSLMDAAAPEQVSEGLEGLAAAAFTYKGSSTSSASDEGSVYSDAFLQASHEEISAVKTMSGREDLPATDVGSQLLPALGVASRRATAPAKQQELTDSSLSNLLESILEEDHSVAASICHADGKSRSQRLDQTISVESFANSSASGQSSVSESSCSAMSITDTISDDTLSTASASSGDGTAPGDRQYQGPRLFLQKRNTMPSTLTMISSGPRDEGQRIVGAPIVSAIRRRA